MSFRKRPRSAFGPIPWQEMVEIGLFAFADGGDDIGEPRLWIDAVEFSSFDQRVDHCSSLTLAVWPKL